MTGLTLKNCDIFCRRVCTYLASLTMGVTLQSPPISAYSSVDHLGNSPSLILRSAPKNLAIATVVEQAQYLPVTAVVKMGGRLINLEVTRNQAEQSKGLMFRPRLPDDRGMLFNFTPPQPVGFWMKNVPVPIDMIFIYRNRVVAIAANVPPCKAEPCPIYPASPILVDQVIEVRANLTKELNVRLGDRLNVQKKSK